MSKNKFSGQQKPIQSQLRIIIKLLLFQAFHNRNHFMIDYGNTCIANRILNSV